MNTPKKGTRVMVEAEVHDADNNQFLFRGFGAGIGTILQDRGETLERMMEKVAAEQTEEAA